MLYRICVNTVDTNLKNHQGDKFPTNYNLVMQEELMIYDDVFKIILLIETIRDAIKYLSPNTM